MRLHLAVAVLALAVVSSCGDLRRVGPGYSYSPTPTPSPATLAELIRSKRIRVGYNIQAIDLVQWSDQSKSLTGVNPDLAGAMSRELGVTVDWSIHQDSSALYEAGRRGQWDIAFAVIDMAQSGMTFTNAYLELEQTYLVPVGSPIRRPADADASGFRIATFGGSNHERYLTQTLTRASVVRTDSTRRAIELARSGEAEAVASSRDELTRLAPMLPGGRILDESVRATRWAVMAASGRQDLVTFVNDWVERAKASGRLRDTIVRFGLVGAAAAAPGP